MLSASKAVPAPQAKLTLLTKSTLCWYDSIYINAFARIKIPRKYHSPGGITIPAKASN